ncbi:MAG: extracellular solute-binding protein [Proteobacteria bacterium]|nr:extracellular solute-binding protein [Pseudomonadota bacterium]
MTRQSNPSREVSRRSVLKAGAGLAGLSAFAAPGLMTHAKAQTSGGFDWKKYKGEKIEVSLAKGPRGDLVQKYRKEFEELTGITVGDEQIPEQQQRQKVLIEFTSGKTTFDVVMISLHVQKKLAAKGNWLEDLRPYIKDAALTAPEFDYPDFTQSGIDYVTNTDGTVGSIPCNLDYFVLFWNKEIFAKKGVAYPKTYEEMVAAVKKLHDPAAGVSGWLGRGLKNANMTPWANFILSWGKDYIENGKLQTDSPDGIASADAYAKLVREFGPPGSVGYNWNECQSVFAQGRGAMWLDGIGFALPLEDPTKSRIVGKIGYGIYPPGPKAHRTSLYGDGYGISRTTNKKGAAWLYIQWATGKLMQARQLQGGYGCPPRKSPFGNADVVAQFRSQREFLDSMLESAKIARPGLPEIVAVTEFRDILGIGLTNIIGGADAATELKRATAEFKPILDKESA